MLGRTSRIKVDDNSGITRVTLLGFPYNNKGIKCRYVKTKALISVSLLKYNAEKLYLRGFTKGKHRATRRKIHK